MISDPPKNGRIDRRTYLAALSAAAATSFAGCSDEGDSDGAGGGGGGGDGGDGDGDGGSGSDGSDGASADLGERVSAADVEVMSGLPSANEMEQAGDYVRGVIEDDLGAPSDITVKEFLTHRDEVSNDERNHHFNISYHPPFPFFLDPNRLMTGYDLRSAGANNRGNLTQFSDCEHTMLVIEQGRTTDPDERRQLVHDAFSIMSEAVERINLLGQAFRGAYRTDQIEVDEIGASSISDFNVELMWEARPIDGDDKIMNITPGNIDSVAYQASAYLELWSHCVYSSLLYYDKDLNLQPSLATDWEVTDDGRRITFDLREGATFHNGDPVTAEDVKWTHEWVMDNYGELALAEEWPYESVDVIDERSVEFNFSEPAGPFLTAHVPMWGILPSDIWIEAGAEDNPASPDIDNDEIVGSGPYQVRNFQPEEILDLEPYEDHWVDVEGNLVFLGFQDPQATGRAFVQGEINIHHDMSGATRDIVLDEIPDQVEVDTRASFMDWWLVPQTNFGPTKFREFRLAVSHALDRSLLNQILEAGDSEPHLYSCLFGKTHPFYPDDPDDVLTRIADSPSPDVEQARSILEDEGWGWDDDGNLHYPPGADLDPLWPQGTEPMDHPDLFPCVEEIESG